MALAEKDGDDILADVYDDIHSELRAKSKQVDRELKKVNVFFNTLQFIFFNELRF